MDNGENIKDNGENIKGQFIDFSTLSDMPKFNSKPEPKQNSINTLIELGYGVDDAREITLSCGVSSHKDSSLSDRIKENFAFLQELGYSQDDVIKMTKSLPTIYDLSIDNMKQKILDLQELGYSQDDVIKMTKSLPAIYSYSIDNMKQKIDFYDSISMHDLAIVDTKQLMQSVALSYARYHFLCERGVIVSTDNYKMLFMAQSKFKNKYGYDNDGIKKLYPYEEDKK